MPKPKKPEAQKGKEPPELRMVLIEADGTRHPVSPFNRETQELREEEAKKIGPLHPFNC